MKEKNTYDIYYDEEGDFLEITFGLPSREGYSEEIEPGVFVTKDEKTNKIVGVGILSFKRRAQVLKNILAKINLKFPLEIGV